jgi:valyl-tRNA synthetase
LVEIEDNFKQYRLSEALMATYKLVWDDYCAWYLEMIKPAYQQPIDSETYTRTVAFFENIQSAASLYAFHHRRAMAR